MSDLALVTGVLLDSERSRRNMCKEFGSGLLGEMGLFGLIVVGVDVGFYFTTGNRD